MDQDGLLRRLNRKSTNMERLVTDVMRQPNLVGHIIAATASDRVSVRFGAVKLLLLLSERAPTVVYSEVDSLIEFLNADNKIFRWCAIQALGHLARVDSRKVIDRILGRYLKPIAGPDLVTAANTIGGATQIARAKPALRTRVVKAILEVEEGNYKTAECRNVAIGRAIDAFDQLYEDSRQKHTIEMFVQRHLGNRRVPTRKRAAQFAHKWMGSDTTLPRKGARSR
jgi:hypothetical protein